MKSGLIALLTLLAPLISAAQAEEFPQAHMYEGHSGFISNLSPPSRLGLYSKPPSALSERERWAMRIHGLRYAMLHPLVWGTRKAEATENRQIIPLKLFVLRSSERPDYKLESIKLNFEFREIPPGLIREQPRDFDPLIEIGFGGEYRAGELAGRALLDRGYVMRISGIRGLETGLYYRSLSTYLQLEPAKHKTVMTGKPKELELRLGADHCTMHLDGKQILNYAGNSMQRGNVTLRTGWSPATITALEIRGRIGNGQDAQEVVESGLVQPFERSSQQEPALANLPKS